MSIFIAALIGAFVVLIGTFVGRVLISLGIGYIIFTGMNLLLDTIKQYVFDYASALPADLLAVLGILQVGTCLNMLFSAFAVRLLLNSITGDSVTKMRVGV